jgi:hypothetical protein
MNDKIQADLNWVNGRITMLKLELEDHEPFSYRYCSVKKMVNIFEDLRDSCIKDLDQGMII